jgi:hypothetical protein
LPPVDCGLIAEASANPLSNVLEVSVAFVYKRKLIRFTVEPAMKRRLKYALRRRPVGHYPSEHQARIRPIITSARGHFKRAVSRLLLDDAPQLC